MNQKYLAIEYFSYREKTGVLDGCVNIWRSQELLIIKWLHRETPEDEMENIKLAELIKEYDERFSHILGYRRMTSWINHFNQTKYSKNRVHRIMKKLGIHSVIRKRRKNIGMPMQMKQHKIYYKEIFTQLHPIKNGLLM